MRHWCIPGWLLQVPYCKEDPRERGAPAGQCGAKTVIRTSVWLIAGGQYATFRLFAIQKVCIANSLNVAYWPPAMSQTEVRITVLAPHWPAGAPRSRGSSLQYGTWSSQPGMHQCRILQKRTIP